MNPLSMNLLILAQEAVSEAPEVSRWQTWQVFLTVVAIVGAPFLLGNLVAQALKMKDYSTKLGLAFFVLVLGFAPFVTRIVDGMHPLTAISLGIDLAGGANLVYQVDRDAAEAEGKEVTPEVMDKMVSAVSLRVNPTGTEQVTVRKVGADRLEVIVPGADDEKVEQTKRRIVNLGELEFALLANENDHAGLIELAERRGPNVSEIYQDGRLVAKWRLPALDEDDIPKIEPGNRVHFRRKTVEGQERLEFLVVVDPDPNRHITGRLLRSVRETVTDRGLAVGFTFNDRGAHLFQQLTARHQPREGAGYRSRLAVLLNNEIHSAPTINAVIGASGVIEGQFTQRDIDELISVLNAGALEVPLIENPVSEFRVSPLLGQDVQTKGFTAIVAAMVAVFLVTVGYYVAAGFVADVCLAINIVLVLGTMSLIDATFTLPGLAGIVLTIGMAVDANVLIFERIREEQRKGSSLRMSIKNGFEKAFSTIFDANVTTLLTAVVLYYIGTDQVKGFAVTLFIGIIMSMFSTLFLGRMIFEIAERKRWLNELKMFSLINVEKFDFLGKKQMAAVASIALIIAGLTAVGIRGSDNLDIDFRGGSMVTFKFDGDVPAVDEVREALGPHFERAISLEELVVTQAGEAVRLFRMRTINPNADEVSQKISEAFEASPYSLVRQHVTLGEIEPIAREDEATEEPDEGAAPDIFAGGHRVVVTLAEPMLPLSLAEEAVESLRRLGQIVEPEGLITGSAVTPGEDPKVNAVLLRFAEVVPAEDVSQVLANLKSRLERNPHFEEVNTFDTAVAGDTRTAAVMAMIFSLLAIIGYLWVRFQRVTFGLAACVALVHDVLIVLGLVAIGAYMSGNPIGNLLLLEDFKINLPIVAAFLTIIGYSLNDTIVVFDRIREVRGRNPALTETMVNASLNQTFSRTILTSVTTLIVVGILYAIGGEGIHGFAYCLILGVLVGTYSSIYVASPVLIWLMNRQNRRMAAT